MRETKVAIRYAKSLIDLAVEKGKLEETNNDMALIAQVCRENRDLMTMLDSPVISSDKKMAVLKAIFGANISELSLSFMLLMTTKKREYLLDDIAAQFIVQYRNLSGIITAEVTSAVALDENIRSQIRAKIGGDKKIEFVEKIDPSLIGGFIVRVGDKQFDGSIARSIADLKKTFSKNDYIPAF
ncbi:MAG: ATP synthase F1 subunit delta [Bacteroidota bacterium]